jgi:hypothetical protein
LDTDSFGATAESLLGAYFGPGYLDERWLAPFNDDLRTGLARFYEQSLKDEKALENFEFTEDKFRKRGHNRAIIPEISAHTALRVDQVDSA